MSLLVKNPPANAADIRNAVHLLDCLWECKLVQPLWRTVWRSVKKLEIELPYDPGIPLLVMYANISQEGDTSIKAE